MVDYFVAGDVGGTKTLLAFYSVTGDCNQPYHLESYPSDEYPTLLSIILTYLKNHQIQPKCVCLGVAGPVVNGIAQITNLNWVVDEKEMSSGLGGIPVVLLNDLAAISQSIPELGGEDFEVINEGKKVEEGTIAVIAPGTGLGEGFMVWEGTRYRAYPSEGGHGDFSPNNHKQGELYQFLYNLYGHVSVERVCSGLGIPNLFDFLRSTNSFDEPDWLRQELDGAEDTTPVIVNYAMQGKDALCSATLALFIEIMAGEAGNMALKFMATGGVYLGGGIPRRLVHQLKQPIFMKNFVNKGRLSGMLMDFPVKIILRADAALIGAARYGYEVLKRAANQE